MPTPGTPARTYRYHPGAGDLFPGARNRERRRRFPVLAAVLVAARPGVAVDAATRPGSARHSPSTAAASRLQFRLPIPPRAAQASAGPRCRARLPGPEVPGRQEALLNSHWAKFFIGQSCALSKTVLRWMSWTATPPQTAGPGLRERKKLATKQALAFAAMQLAKRARPGERPGGGHHRHGERLPPDLHQLLLLQGRGDRLAERRPAARAAEALRERPADEPLADSLAAVFAAQHEAAAHGWTGNGSGWSRC